MPEFDFGHFHVLSELGRGGMALVYKAIDTRTQETVALKILYPHLMSDDNTIKRFQREAKVAARLKHKFIVPVIEFGEHDDQIYIAMQYMPGNSLAELFLEPRAVKLKGTVRLLSEVASALDYAHGNGVIHRDLKLQNILLDAKRHAHLADFGIARLVDGTRLTATGQIAGTPMYMSPEQIRGKQVDFRSDIYSFSVMAYLMLTGYYPFTGEDSLSIIHKHVKEYPPVPTEVNNELPESINAILLRGLMKDPDDRFESTMAMVKALHAAVNTPEMHHTTTRIDIHALNPVDSIEMDAMPAEDRISSVTGDAAASQVASGTQASQSNVSSAVMTGPGVNNSRIGMWIGIIGVLVIAAILIPVVLLTTRNNNSEQINVASTQSRLQLELELTQTALAVPVVDVEDADNEEEPGNEQVNASQVDNVTSTSAPTMAPTATMTPTPTQVAWGQANGVIASSRGATVQSGPGPDADYIATLSDGTAVEVIGRTGLNDYLELQTEDGIRGFVQVTQINTDIDIFALPVTFFPKTPPGSGRPPRNNAGGSPPGG